MADLAAMWWRSGGYSISTRRALGEFPAFVVGWTDFLAQCGSTAAVAIVIGEYLGDLFPALHGALMLPGFYVEKKVVMARLTGVAVAIQQWRGIKAGSLMQNLTSSAKTLAFVALIAAILILAPSATQTSHPEIVHQAGFAAAIILAMQAVIYTYDGWYGVIYFGEEVKQPGRDVPRAMFGGVLAVMAIYVLVNVALVHALPLSKIAGDQMPAGPRAALVFWPPGETSLRRFLIVSMISGINAYHLMASRIPYAMATAGLLTPPPAPVHKSA